MKNLIISIISFVVILGLTFTSINAQKAVENLEAELTGFVLDVDTAEPIEGALVEIYGHDVSAYTNETGSFSFSGLDAEEVTLVITADGYADGEKEVELNGDHTEVTISLEPEE